MICIVRAAFLSLKVYDIPVWRRRVFACLLPVFFVVSQRFSAMLVLLGVCLGILYQIMIQNI